MRRRKNEFAARVELKNITRQIKRIIHASELHLMN